MKPLPVLAIAFAYFVSAMITKSNAGIYFTTPTNCLVVGDTTPNLGDRIFERAVIQPSVDKELWEKHLRKKMNKFIRRAVSEGMRPGTYNIQVRFLVGKDGSVSDLQALSNPGFGLAEAAQELVKTGPKWNPAKTNGDIIVRSYHMQMITFIIPYN